MTITAEQLRRLWESDNENGFAEMAKLANGQVDSAKDETARHATTITDLRRKRVSRQVLAEVLESGKVPEDHQDDESLKKLRKVQSDLTEALKVSEGRSDYDKLKTQLVDSGKSVETLTTDLGKANERISGYERKDLRKWHERQVDQAIEEHSFPVPKDMRPVVTDRLSPFMRQVEGKKLQLVSSNGDGDSPLTLDGAAVDMKGLLEDLRTAGKIVGMDQRLPSAFVKVTEGPTHESSSITNQPRSADLGEDLSAAIASKDLDAVNAALRAR